MSVGSGAAGGPSTPKQFLSIAGVPVLVHCLRAFAAVPRVEAIFVAVRKPEIQRVRAQVAEFGLGNKICVVEGGDLRQQSVSNALTKLVALAVDEAKARGIKVVTLHASKFGRPVYEQYGFRPSTEMMLRPGDSEG